MQQKIQEFKITFQRQKYKKTCSLINSKNARLARNFFYCLIDCLIAKIHKTLKVAHNF